MDYRSSHCRALVESLEDRCLMAATVLSTTTATYVRDGSYSNARFGSAVDLQVKKWSADWTRESYLRFNLTSVATIGSAKLRLHGRLNNANAASVKFNVYNAANTTWAESSTTWNTRPAISSIVRGSGTVAGTTAKWYDVDLTGFLKAEKAAGRNLVTLVIRAAGPSDAVMVFASDEASTNRPHLEVSQTSTPNLASLQRAYLDQKYGMMLHFGGDTYTNGDEYAPADPNRFNPTQLDTDQWAAVAKASGMKYGVLTTKHHSGFASWDSSQTNNDVAASQWYKNEQAAGRSGDVVRRFVDSFRAQGLGVGLYYSVWDISAKIDTSSNPAAATAHVKAELTQLLKNYGQIQILWTDGWVGRVGYDVVNWQSVYDHIKTISPGTLLLENNNHHTLAKSDIAGYEFPYLKTLPPSGNLMPAEVSDTITSDSYWFYRSFHTPLQSAQALADRRRTANARTANYLLNVGPDTSGRITDSEVQRLSEAHQAWLAMQ